MKLTVDAHQVHGNLWQGGAPPTGSEVREAGFTALILCAKGYQPAGKEFVGVRVFHAPMADAFEGLTPREIETWLSAADAAARLVRSGHRVLVTCMAGRNRSGIVSVEALRRLGYSAADGIRMVRQARGPMALSNPAFVRMLQSPLAGASPNGRYRVQRRRPHGQPDR